MWRFLSDVAAWFTAAEHWQGDHGIVHRLAEHLGMSAAATLAAVAIALPIGLVLGHTGRAALVAVNVSNIGRAIPSFALLVFGVQLFGIGAKPAFIALVALAVPPIVTNAYTGIRQVDRDVVEAARGMGMREHHILLRVEVPVAMPLVMAGVRTAGVQVVATATLAAVVAWGGLGRYIVDGLAQKDSVQVFSGALLVAVLAMLAELGLALLQRVLTPAGLRLRRRGARKVSILPGAAAAPEVG
ncbi:MAG TPA: ABC transporter permease [Acidimicrobiales bacterium]|jgi:osmoprotectant transport system permease protein|nr:ABC transporter permease [Acidimicrobiales bacterium]